MPAPSPETLADLIACPKCDALYRTTRVEKGDTARCHRCHAPLFARRHHAGRVIIALSSAAVILAVAAVFLPFIEIKRLGFHNSATVADTALAFIDGPMFALSVAVIGFIVALPILRLCLTTYTLAPLVWDRKPWPRARHAFKLSERLRPWSMAEIFLIGCAVSLIKLSDLATVNLGPAFWMFVGVVILMTLQDLILCRWSVWTALDR